MRIVIIGTGNTATVLGRLMIAAQHQVIQVFGRNGSRAGRLARELKCTFTTEAGEIDTTGDVYVLAISDTALYEVSGWLHLHDQLVVHTAGSVSLDVLAALSQRYGVLYPLQSLRKEMHTIPAIPFLVDGNSEEVTNVLSSFAATLSANVSVANSEERKKLHLAAVITSNFTNHLYALTQEYCKKENVEFNLLTPLLTEIAARASLGNARDLQTGPAVRRDILTIEKQKDMLTAHPSLLKLYEVFTESIAAAP